MDAKLVGKNNEKQDNCTGDYTISKYFPKRYLLIKRKLSNKEICLDPKKGLAFGLGSWQVTNL